MVILETKWKNQLWREEYDGLARADRTDGNVRIMVTMPSEAASDYGLIRDLVRNGMDCMRINCAHDDEDAWAGMVENLRRAERELSKECRVLMDVPGPKLRTGPIRVRSRDNEVETAP